MRFLVLGCGSIGRRHIGNLLSLGVTEVAAYDIDPERRQEVEARFHITAFPGLEEAWSWHPQAVVVATPTSLHLSQAMEAALRGSHLFVEKPPVP